MGKKSRADRRHHHQRMLNRVKKFFWYKNWFSGEEHKEQHQKRMTETRKPCSCHMCGNPRRMFKEKTMQEKRFEQNVEE
jgi:hypothetical protein